MGLSRSKPRPRSTARSPWTRAMHARASSSDFLPNRTASPRRPQRSGVICCAMRPPRRRGHSSFARRSCVSKAAMRRPPARATMMSPPPRSCPPPTPSTRIRLGGLVKPGSIARGQELAVRFAVTDGNREIAVAFTGALPDLFREGQGVIAEGALDGAGLFKADTVLAKHDETYMPREVADALKQQGHWKDGKP